MMSQACREIGEKSRGFEYKCLCDKSRPMTTKLFGDNIPEDMKQINLTKQLAGRPNNRYSVLYRGRGSGQSQAPHQQQQIQKQFYNNN